MSANADLRMGAKSHRSGVRSGSGMADEAVTPSWGGIQQDLAWEAEGPFFARESLQCRRW